jgi:hypothetical protein
MALYRWIFYPSSEDSADLRLLKAFLRNTIVFVPMILVLALTDWLLESLIPQTSSSYRSLKIMVVAGLCATLILYLKRLACEIIGLVVGRRVCP